MNLAMRKATATENIARLLAPDFDKTTAFARSVFRAQAHKIVEKLIDVPEHMPPLTNAAIYAELRKAYETPSKVRAPKRPQGTGTG